MGCFWGRPQPHFMAGLVGLISLQGTFRVNKSTFSSSGSASAFSSILWVFLDQK